MHDPGPTNPGSTTPASWAVGDKVTCWIEDQHLYVVHHNAGLGTAATRATVTEGCDGSLTAMVDDHEIIIERPESTRFLAAVDAMDDGIVLLHPVKQLDPPVAMHVRRGRFNAAGRSWTPAELGVNERDILNPLSDKPYQLTDVTASPPGHWIIPGSSLVDYTDGWRHAREEAHLRERRRNHVDTHFINPYTFVGWPDQPPDRDTPPGHDRSTSKRPLVTLTVTWQAVTPVATRTVYRGTDGCGLSGSSVKGALRSFHEALTGSCLRVVDFDASPVHRETIQPGGGANRKLARVQSITGPSADGRYTIVFEVAARTVWVPHQHLPTPLTSGTPLPSAKPAALASLTGTVAFDSTRKRDQFSPSGTATPFANPAEEWVPLLSHERARHHTHGYHVALGSFPVAGGGTAVSLMNDDPVWRAYEQCAEDADDPRHRRNGSAVTVDVAWNRKAVGARQEVLGALTGPSPVIQPGRLFWLELNGSAVTAVKAAVVWRRSASTTVRDRVPSGFEPCLDPTALCPSCRVFGGAGGDAEHRGQAGQAGAGPSPNRPDGQRGYRGHVHMGPMVTAGAPEEVAVAPMGTPGLGSGQLYLNEPQGTRQTQSRAERPIREWDSAADRPTARRLRGRKFYWPADPDEQQRRRRFPQPRWKAAQTPYGLGPRGQTAHVWPTGTTFTQRITVVGLDRVSLGGLVACLQPHRLDTVDNGDWSRAVQRVGYGKPLGLGVIKAVGMDVSVQAPGDRYGTPPKAPKPLAEDEIGANVSAFAASTPPAVRKVWVDLRAVCDPEHVWSEYVTYPVDSWDDYAQQEKPLPANGTYSFKFWQRSAGNDKFKLWPMPTAADRDQLMPLQPEDQS